MSGEIFEMFLADLSKRLPWGPHVVTRLRELYEAGDFGAESIHEAFQNVATEDGGADA